MDWLSKQLVPSNLLQDLTVQSLRMSLTRLKQTFSKKKSLKEKTQFSNEVYKIPASKKQDTPLRRKLKKQVVHLTKTNEDLNKSLSELQESEANASSTLKKAKKKANIY